MNEELQGKERERYNRSGSWSSVFLKKIRPEIIADINGSTILSSESGLYLERRKRRNEGTISVQKVSAEGFCSGLRDEEWISETQKNGI